MAYGITQDVRELAGALAATDFPDPEILEEQEAAKDVIDARLGKTFEVGDNEYQLVQRVENHLAASFVISHGGPGMKDEAQRLWEKGMMLLEILEKSQFGDEADREVFFASSNYMSYPLGLADNPDTIPHRSTRPTNYL